MSEPELTCHAPGELSPDEVRAFVSDTHVVFADVLRPMEELAGMPEKWQRLAHALVLRDGDGSWLGACFGYCNDFERRRAYLAYISKARPGLRGVGRRLIEGLVRLAREAGMRSLDLEVAKSNVAAQTFYARMGFREFARGEESIFLRIDLEGGE